MTRSTAHGRRSLRLEGLESRCLFSAGPLGSPSLAPAAGAGHDSSPDTPAIIAVLIARAAAPDSTGGAAALAAISPAGGVLPNARPWPMVPTGPADAADRLLVGTDSVKFIKDSIPYLTHGREGLAAEATRPIRLELPTDPNIDALSDAVARQIVLPYIEPDNDVLGIGRVAPNTGRAGVENDAESFSGAVQKVGESSHWSSHAILMPVFA